MFGDADWGKERLQTTPSGIDLSEEA